jgi:hypothetical protein
MTSGELSKCTPGIDPLAIFVLTSAAKQRQVMGIAIVVSKNMFRP